MKLRWVVVTTCILMLSAMVCVRAADSEKPAEHKAKSSARLTQPWSKMSDLSDEQKTKIRDIHAKANDEIKAIHEKETADIMSLLSDEQKAEAQKLLDSHTRSHKSKSKAKDTGAPTADNSGAKPANAGQ